MASLYTPVSNRENPYSYSKFYKEENATTFNSLTFPMKLRDILKFEKENENKDITVSVFGVHEWKDRKKKKKFISDCSSESEDITMIDFEPEDKKKQKESSESISTMSDSESDSEPEEEMTEEDKEFLDDQTVEEDLSMYRKIDSEILRSEMENVSISQPKPQPQPDNMRGYVYPIRIASHIGARHVNLLLTEKDGSSHFSAIKNLDGFLRAQYTKGDRKHFHCYRCLHGFVAKTGEKSRDQCKNLQEHMTYCKTLNPQLVSYPKDGVAEFTNLRKMLKAPVVCYADFESTLERTSNIDTTTGIGDEPEKKTTHTKYQAHKPVSYFTKVVSIDPKFQLDQEQDFQFPQKDTYVGEDCVSHFLDYMTKVADKTYHKLFDKPSEMIFTPEDEIQYNAATECHICDKRYSGL